MDCSAGGRLPVPYVPCIGGAAFAHEPRCSHIEFSERVFQGGKLFCKRVFPIGKSSPLWFAFFPNSAASRVRAIIDLHESAKVHFGVTLSRG